MDQIPLVIEQIDAGNRFLHEFQQYLPIHAAFWLREADAGDWNLYVVSDQITEDNFDIAYGEVVRITGQLRDPWFDPFQVKLIGASEPLAQAALEMQQHFPGRMPTRFHGKTFGGLSVDEVYIYPLPVSTVNA
jgi:hypothetical protein